MDSVLRPRDIQARIRAGESPERVAEAAQTTTDRIMAFAAPVLAERAYVAQQAQKASVRRRAGDGPVGQLGDAVSSRLATREVRADDVEWDAWRREDGRWTLVAEYAVAGSPHRAQFAYDTAGRYVVAEDDEARALVGERAGAERTEQLPLGDDAIEVVTGRRPEPIAPQEPGDEPTVDLTDTASAVRPEPYRAGPVRPDAPDWISTQATDRPAAPAEETREEPAAEPEALFDVEPPLAPVDEPSAVAAGDGPPDAADDQRADGSGEAPEEEPAAPRKRAKAKSKGRASVPSWDEIMFGSGRGEG
jgi:hypothetical protein